MYVPGASLIWDCPEVDRFWIQVSTTLMDIFETEMAYCSKGLLLNHDNCFAFSFQFFTEESVAKKVLALH